jgi:uncharacterized protein
VAYNLDVINKILGDFVSTSSSIDAAAVMTRDGHLVASNLHANVDGDRLSAISASLLSLADRATKDLHQGNLKQVLIANTDGLILMLKVGDNAVLSVVSKANSSLGMLLHEAKKSAATLAHLI